MRFLYVMLSAVWLLYAWVCFEALRWQPPIPIPWHAAAALQDTTPERVNARMEEARMLLGAGDLTGFQRASAHYQLATAYWMKAYLQDSRRKQLTYLRLSLRECEKALEMMPNSTHIKYSIADLHHQMHNFGKAERIYQEVLEEEPNNPRYRQRYEDLLNDRARYGSGGDG